MKETVANDTLTGAISNLKSSKTKTNDVSFKLSDCTIG